MSNELGIVLAMTLAYAVSFAGLLLAYVSYKKRKKDKKKEDQDD